MKVQVDSSKCTGHGRCHAAAPRVYELDDEGYCSIVTLDVPPALAAQARDGADDCPEQAITIGE
jgi:ferredoxin